MKKWLINFSLAVTLLSAPFAFGYQEPDPQSNSSETPDPEYSPKGIFTGALNLPDIVRFKNLPMRMHLDPVISGPVILQRLDERLVPLWIRVLGEATDTEIQVVAAQSLSRVAELGLADIQSAGPTLMKVAASSSDESTRYLCAKAMASGNIQAAAADLIALALSGTDSQRLLIEPALARWKVVEAAELWKPRIADPEVSGISFRLAAEGLTSINDTASAAALLVIVGNQTTDFSKRTAAARATAILDPALARAAADSLITMDIQNRLLALALLNSAQSESVLKTVTLCNDPSDAVASNAWLQAFRWKPELLTANLSTGYRHSDSAVRMTAAKVIRLFPDSERTAMLQTLISDIHIEVRNVARQMLFAVATEHPELKDTIVGRASDMLKPDSPDWQGIEQSLVLLGQLQSTQFSNSCLALLDYPRDEVGISAAWLIQLSPDFAVYDRVRNYIEQTEEKLLNEPAAPSATVLREAMLLQYAGLVRMKELQPLLDKQFSKSAPGGPEKRASALWALGLLFEKNPVPELVAKYEARIKDRSSLPPESLEVRRMSVMSLGLMRATTSIEVVKEAYEVDMQDSFIPGTARWIFPLLGQPMPPDFQPIIMLTGGWRINPTNAN